MLLVNRFEDLLDEAADLCRGKTMTEEEWQNCRQLWAGLGMVLGPCRPHEDNTVHENDNDAFDKAMDLLS